MRALRDSGFFDPEPVEISGAAVAPRALSEKLLGRAWALGENEEEVTYLSVEVGGEDASGLARRYFFELLDRTAQGVTSMARTTGFPCAAVAAMLARGEYRDPGIRPLEMLPRDPSASARFLEAIQSRGLAWTERWTDRSGDSQT